MHHSGVLCFDLDKLPLERLATARAKLEADDRIAAVFLSPSGRGIKVLMLAEPPPRDDAEHKLAYAEGSTVLSDLTGEKLDSTGDVCRACFASADRELFLRDQPRPVSWAAAPTPKPAPKGQRKKPLNSPPHGQNTNLSSLHSAHRTRAGVVQKPKRSREALRIRDRQDKLYRKLVAPYTPPAGERNEWLMKTVPFLANACAPAVVLSFLTRHFDQFAEGKGWAATQREHLGSVRALLDGSTVHFPTILSSAERAIFDTITNPTEQNLFRICRALAFYDARADGLPIGVFALSAMQAAARLGIGRTRAAQLLESLAARKVLYPEEKGAVWCAGCKPRGTLWRWLLTIEREV